MENIYWKAGTSFPVEAKVAADTIKRLQQTLGKDFVTAKELLDASRDDNAPLHCCFEWDDSVAAELFRTEQARRIVGSIEIEIVKETSAPALKTRLFVNVQPVMRREQGKFVAFDVAFGNKDYRQQVLHNALGELLAFKRKYSSYQELTDVFNAIGNFADNLK